MIYPTRLSVLAALTGAPLALLAGLLAPGLWMAAPAWLLGLGLLMLVDTVMAASPADARIELQAPE
jgi:hypothetical protein